LPLVHRLPGGGESALAPSDTNPLGGQVEGHEHDKDTRMLHALGYAQELSRKMSGFSNFAISFTIISILSGTLTLYYQGINYGGPVEEAYGWPLVSLFVIIVGLGMAEIASKYPTAGGLYYWASKMGGASWGWFTGWFNLIGQIAITAGIDYGAAVFTDARLQLLWSNHFTASAHMSEETQNASRCAARGVSMSIVVSAVFGYILALGVTFAIQDIKTTGAAGTFAVKQVFIDSLGTTTAKVMLAIIVGAQFYC